MHFDYIGMIAPFHNVAFRDSVLKMLIFQQKLLTQAFQSKNFAWIAFQADFYYFPERPLPKKAQGVERSETNAVHRIVF